MIQQLPLFDAGPPLPPTEAMKLEALRLGRTCTPDRVGSGPAGETCGTCVYCVQSPTARRPSTLKCSVVQDWWTHGAGTDIRARWAACSHWEQRDESSAS